MPAAVPGGSRSTGVRACCDGGTTFGEPFPEVVDRRTPRQVKFLTHLSGDSRAREPDPRQETGRLLSAPDPGAPGAAAVRPMIRLGGDGGSADPDGMVPGTDPAGR